MSQHFVNPSSLETHGSRITCNFSLEWIKSLHTSTFERKWTETTTSVHSKHKYKELISTYEKCGNVRARGWGPGEFFVSKNEPRLPQNRNILVTWQVFRGFALYINVLNKNGTSSFKFLSGICSRFVFLNHTTAFHLSWQDTADIQLVTGGLRTQSLTGQQLLHACYWPWNWTRDKLCKCPKKANIYFHS